jgi:hypothetical protein
MIIHNTEIDPTTITRLRIVHRDGELDLCGAHAVEALRAIRRVRPKPSKGKPGPKPAITDAVRLALTGETGTVGDLAAATGLSRLAVASAVRRLVASGVFTIAEPIRQPSGQMATRFKLATP